MNHEDLLSIPPLTVILTPEEHCTRRGGWSFDNLRLREDMAEWCDSHIKPGWVFEVQEFFMEVKAMSTDEKIKADGVFFKMPSMRFVDFADELAFRLRWM